MAVQLNGAKMADIIPQQPALEGASGTGGEREDAGSFLTLLHSLGEESRMPPKKTADGGDGSDASVFEKNIVEYDAGYLMAAFFAHLDEQASAEPVSGGEQSEAEEGNTHTRFDPDLLLAGMFTNAEPNEAAEDFTEAAVPAVVPATNLPDAEAELISEPNAQTGEASPELESRKNAAESDAVSAVPFADNRGSDAVRRVFGFTEAVRALAEAAADSARPLAEPADDVEVSGDSEQPAEALLVNENVDIPRNPAEPDPDKNGDEPAAEQAKPAGRGLDASHKASAVKPGEEPARQPHASLSTEHGEFTTAGTHETPPPAATEAEPPAQTSYLSTSEVAYRLDGRKAFVDGIATVLRFLGDDGIDEARIVVEPPALGRIDVSIQSTSTGVEATFRVDNEVLRQMLQGQIDLLKESLQAQGIHVSGLTVDIKNRDDERRQDAPHDRSGRKVRRMSDEDAIGEPERTLRLDLEQGLLHWVA